MGAGRGQTRRQATKSIAPQTADFPPGFSEQVSKSILIIGQTTHTLEQLAEATKSDPTEMWVVMQQLLGNGIVASVSQVICPSCNTIICRSSETLPPQTELTCEICSAYKDGKVIAGGNTRTAYIAKEAVAEKFYENLRGFKFSRELEGAATDVSQVRF